MHKPRFIVYIDQMVSFFSLKSPPPGKGSGTIPSVGGGGARLLSSTWEIKEVQGHPELNNKFKDSLGCRRSY